jgi:mRNA interferase MazF
MRGVGHAQVWWADLEKVRPVVILTRSRIAPRLSRVLVAPVTTTVRNISTEVPLGQREGVQAGSVANLDNAHVLPVDRLLSRAGWIPAERWVEFCQAMAKVMSC